MKDSGDILYRFPGDSRFGHSVIKPLNVGPLDCLQLYSPHHWDDMIFDDPFIAAVGQGLHLPGAEGGQPLLHPLGDCDLVGGGIGPVVQGGHRLGQFLADLLLGGPVDRPLYLPAGPQIPS